MIHWLQSSQLQSALLRKIIDRIRNSLELKVVLQTAVDEVAAILDLDDCLFCWYFHDTDRVQVVCEYSTACPTSRLGYYPASEFGTLASILAQGQLLVSGKVSGPAILQAITRKLARPTVQTCPPIFGVESYLMVPVVGQEGSIGYLACLSQPPRNWSTTEIEFMRAMAQQLEIAVQQAHLYEQTQRQAQREKLVNQITTQTRQSFELEAILTQAIAQLMEGLQADRCLVHLVEDISDTRGMGIGEPLAPTEQTALRRQHLYEVCRSPFPPSIDDFDTHGPITQWVIQHRQQVVITDVSQDERIGPNNEEYQKAHLKSSLVVPVQANGTLHAILYLNQCSHVRYWSSNDQKLAQAVADQLAISIQQAHLYAQTQRQAIESATQAQHLAAAMQELQLTQAQLIQSEKLSSLGQMVAGIAHEINNPIGFIYSNIPYVERYIHDLVQLLEAYQAEYTSPSPALKHLAEEVDLPFLVQDLFKILGSMQSGSDRIRQIVLSLRNFSRLDEANCKEVDLHEGLESTLTLLQGKTEGVQIIRQYGELPLVECYPRLLNQVFMSLLTNALEALQSTSNPMKRMTIRTHLLVDQLTGNHRVRIAIADNGPGISSNVQAKMFDPFFTTKEIGQGKGLGLAMSYQIIANQHQGRLTCVSEPNQGAEFTIEIPICHSKGKLHNEYLSLLPRVSIATQTPITTGSSSNL